jgi:hypothetical protein
MHALQLHRSPRVPDHGTLDHDDLDQVALDTLIDSPELLNGGLVDAERDAEPREPGLRLEGDSANFLDMATIRQRVASIKNRWSPETVRARAIEGARRRVELEGLVAGLIDLDADERFGEDSELRLFL